MEFAVWILKIIAIYSLKRTDNDELSDADQGHSVTKRHTSEAATMT